jgi:hypothetical protein
MANETTALVLCCSLTLLVAALGQPQTALADGIFGPFSDQVRLTGVRTLTVQVKSPGRRSRLQADWVEPKLECQR